MKKRKKFKLTKNCQPNFFRRILGIRSPSRCFDCAISGREYVKGGCNSREFR